MRFDYPSQKRTFQGKCFAPFDNYFKSTWKRKTPASRQQGAIHKSHWPAGSHFKPSEETMKLLMREHGSEVWTHVRNLAPQIAKDELAAWKRENPNHTFKVMPR